MVYVVARSITPQSVHLEMWGEAASVSTNLAAGRHWKELGWARDQKEPFSSEDFWMLPIALWCWKAACEIGRAHV